MLEYGEGQDAVLSTFRFYAQLFQSRQFFGDSLFGGARKGLDVKIKLQNAFSASGDRHRLGFCMVQYVVLPRKRKPQFAFNVRGEGSRIA